MFRLFTLYKRDETGDVVPSPTDCFGTIVDSHYTVSVNY